MLGSRTREAQREIQVNQETESLKKEKASEVWYMTDCKDEG